MENRPTTHQSDNPGSEKLLLRALAGERLSRPPFWLMRQAGRYLPEYRQLRQQAGSFLELCYDPALATEVTLQPIRRFAMDAAILFADILLVPQAMGRSLTFREGEGPVLEPLRRRDEAARLRPEAIHDTLAPVYETLRRLRVELPPAVTLIGFAGAPWTVATYMVEGGSSRDFANVKRWAFEDPDGFSGVIDALVEATADYLAAQVTAGAEVVQLFDTWAGVLPERDFERWCVQPVRAIAERLRSVHPDVPIIGFPRGAGAGYAGYVAAAGVDAVGLDWTVPLAWARDVLQAQAAVQGNLDPRYLLVRGAAMEAEIERILAALGGGPFVFNLGHGIVPETPPEHVARLAELVRGFDAGDAARS